MAKDSIRLGIVGLRNIGLAHLRRTLDLDHVSVAALADTEPKRVDEARHLAGPRVACYRTAEELFSSDETQAVVLAVPNPLHAPMAIAAMRQGKDVLVEKPMALSSAEAQQMIRVRNETERTLMVGMNQRFVPSVVTARNRLAEGVIGDVQQSRTCWLRDRTGAVFGSRGAWCLNASMSGGGPLMDLGIHKLDLVLYLLGYPRVKTISGYTSSGIGRRLAAEHGLAYEVEDYAFGLIHFADHSVLNLETSFFRNVPGERQDTLICGTAGSLHFDKRSATLISNSSAGLVEAELEPDSDTAVNCVEHFCRVLRREEDLIPTPEQGLLGLQIVEAIYKSAKTGVQVELPAGEI